jgi:hypothetical protein
VTFAKEASRGVGPVAVSAPTKRVPVDRAVVELLALDVLALPVAVAALAM